MHINLILENEQRSASPVTFAMFIRIVAGTLIVLVLLGLFSVYFSYRELQNSVRYCDTEWVQTEPKFLAAQQLRQDLIARSAKLKEIQGWHTTRVEWGRQMDGVQALIPSLIQLTELKVSQDILMLSNNVPARVFELRLSGRTAAPRSEVNVSEFQTALFKVPPFDTFVESVNIPAGAFRQDPLNKTDRVFEIVCKYNPRSFE